VGRSDALTWATRALFVALILVMVAGKALTSKPAARGLDAERRLAAVLAGRQAAPITTKIWGTAQSQSFILTAPVKGCAHPLTVATVRPSYLMTTALLQADAADVHHLYAYLDWVTAKPDRWRLLRERAAQRLKAVVGLSPFDRDDIMLFITEPRGCDLAAGRPWRRFWLAASPSASGR
jgi:hypothetical protein